MNVEPRSGPGLSAVIVPRWPFTIARTMKSPRPGADATPPHLGADAVEAGEDEGQVRAAHPDAVVAHPHVGLAVGVAPHLDLDLDAVPRVLDRVVEQVDDRRLQGLRVPGHAQAGRPLVADGLLRELVPGGGELDRVAGDAGEVERPRVGHRPVGVHRGVQDVVDGRVQPLDVLPHRPVELRAPLGGHVAVLERVEVELERGHRRLQLVGDGAHEVRLPLVEAHLAQQQDDDEHEAGDEEQEEQASEEVGDDAGGAHGAGRRLGRGQDLPGHGEGHRHHDEPDADGHVVPLGPPRARELGGLHRRRLEELVEVDEEAPRAEAAPQPREAREPGAGRRGGAGATWSRGRGRRAT